MYTMGGIERIELARKYFQQAEELKPGNARSLYGLCLCVAALGSGKKPREEPEHMSNLFGFTQNKLETAYAKSGNRDTAPMTAALNALRP